MAFQAAIPPGGTWFDTLKKSFVDVPVDSSNGNAIPTSEFLEAAESLTTLFGEQSSSLSSFDSITCLRSTRFVGLAGIHPCQE